MDWTRLGVSPHSATIMRRFGSWNAALQVSGLTPRRVRRGWSDPDVLDGLRRFAPDHGRPPRANDRVGSLSIYPSPALAVSRFGSWGAALDAAGLEPGNPAPVTERDILRVLQAYHREHGRSPTSSGWKRAGYRPHAETINRHYGSWAAALALAVLTPGPQTPRRPIRGELIELLRNYKRAHGTRSTVTTWRNAHLTPSVKVFYRQFGSWQRRWRRQASPRQRGSNTRIRTTTPGHDALTRCRLDGLTDCGSDGGFP